MSAKEAFEHCAKNSYTRASALKQAKPEVYAALIEHDILNATFERFGIQNDIDSRSSYVHSSI